MTNRTKDKKLTGVDRAWGYTFGQPCGVVSVPEAMRIMSIGRTKLYALINENKIRHGRIDRKAVICRQSIIDYLSTVEV